MYIAVYYQNEPVFVCHTKYRQAAKEVLDHWEKISKEFDDFEIVELQFDPFFRVLVTDMEMNMSMRFVKTIKLFSVIIALFFFMLFFEWMIINAVLGCYQWNQVMWTDHQICFTMKQFIGA